MDAEDQDDDLIVEGNKLAREMLEAVKRVENSLGLKRPFLFGLSREDDWTLVIKLHALIEAAIEEVVVRRCFASAADNEGRDDAAIARLVGRMPFDGRVSKLSLVKAFRLLDEDHFEFVVTLAEVRNRYAHRPSNFAKSIRSLLGSNAEGKAKLQKLMLGGNMTATSEAEFDGGLKATMVIVTSGVLWALHFRSVPPASLSTSGVSGFL